MKGFHALVGALCATALVEAGSYPAPSGGSAPAPAPSPEEGHVAVRPAPRGDGQPAPSVDDDPATTESPLPGCRDTSACNYDASANTDDGTCSYPAVGANCDGSCLDDSPPDCLGLCGGNSVCCPATCSVDGSKDLMSCDDVGAGLGDASAQTCASLEFAGCDCAGCGCGYIVDEDGYEVVEGMESSSLTCDKTEKIEQPCTAAKQCTASECKGYCTALADCEYAGWNTQGGCILYSSCKVTRTVAAVTTTYYEVPSGLGVVNDGTCTCTWWTCVNDGGLGYCPE